MSAPNLKPQFTCHGYDTKSLADQFDAKPAEIRQLLRGGLDPARARGADRLCVRQDYHFDSGVRNPAPLAKHLAYSHRL